ncbi:hypothetical protein [Chlorogloea sp. CCALA 695]|uniref:hypothetical protein n=1 Tax=Chlorogloea sp. CCALA 695 TaxID=2107693 RepID=UPI000D04BE0F|nr:hypothetical protein [Chlorogloea sp. CCALA 695]PSB29615.1 hypothetical protein C7B70_18185 [Chlorogloea sp. CCALA 695]
MLTQEKRTIQLGSESTPKIWDKATAKANIGDTIHAPFMPVMQVINKDVYSDGRVWLKVKPTNASCYTEEWVLDREEDDVLPPPPNEFEQGFNHGRIDAIDKSIPLYTRVECEYTRGYTEGYKQHTKPNIPTPPPKPLTWSVTYDRKWQWYLVWVGGRAIGRADDHEEAEQIGQKYLASEKLRQEHRERVLAFYRTHLGFI